MTSSRIRSGRLARGLVVAGIFALLVPSTAVAETRTSSVMDDVSYTKILDVVVLRPMGVFALLAGCAAFVPVALISAPGGRESLDDSLEIFVLTPYRQTFERPIGDL